MQMPIEQHHHIFRQKTWLSICMRLIIIISPALNCQLYLMLALWEVCPFTRACAGRKARRLQAPCSIVELQSPSINFWCLPVKQQTGYRRSITWQACSSVSSLAINWRAPYHQFLWAASKKIACSTNGMPTETADQIALLSQLSSWMFQIVAHKDVYNCFASGINSNCHQRKDASAVMAAVSGASVLMATA